MKLIGSLHSLEELSLSGIGKSWGERYVRLPDNAIQDLTRLKGLRNLQINNAMISDNGLARIADLGSLSSLSLSSCTVSDEGVKKLRQAIPRCTIHR
jgi:hypothetical protein